MAADDTQTFASVWDALEETPEAAVNMRLRAELMLAIGTVVDSWVLTQAKAAARLNVSQPRLSDLRRGRISLFSLDALVTLAGRAGLSVEMTIRDAA